MTYIGNITRSAGDPKIVLTGPSSMTTEVRLARALGWFSIGLGAIEFLAPRRITRTLGIRGNERLVRAYGVREIASGILSLSLHHQTGLKSRVAGDGLDIVTLLSAFRSDNPKKGNVGLALLMVGGVTLLDLIGAQGTKVRHNPQRGERRSYRDRTGFPKGIAAVKGIAKKFQAPPQMRIPSSQGDIQSSRT